MTTVVDSCMSAEAGNVTIGFPKPCNKVFTFQVRKPEIAVSFFQHYYGFPYFLKVDLVCIIEVRELFSTVVPKLWVCGPPVGHNPIFLVYHKTDRLDQEFSIFIFQFSM